MSVVMRDFRCGGVHKAYRCCATTSRKAPLTGRFRRVRLLLNGHIFLICIFGPFNIIFQPLFWRKIKKIKLTVDKREGKNYIIRV